MKYSELEQKLKKQGSHWIRDGKKHPWWNSPITGKEFQTGHHKSEEVKPGTLNQIVRDSGIKLKILQIIEIMKIDVFIEKGFDGTFDVHFGEQTNGLTFSLLGQGNTVQEAIGDFYNSRDEIKEYYIETGKPFPENLEFAFKYDTASFLTYYSHVFSLAGLGRLTGVAQGQLSHYVTGKRKPSQKTVQKIEKSLHEFAKEIGQVQLV